MGLAARQHVGSSWIGDQTHVSYIGRWTLYHWASRLIACLLKSVGLRLYFLLADFKPWGSHSGSQSLAFLTFPNSKGFVTFKCDSLYQMLLQHLWPSRDSLLPMPSSPSLTVHRGMFCKAGGCIPCVSRRKYLHFMWGLSFIFSRKLKSKVSELHPSISFPLPVSVEPQLLTLVFQIKLFSFWRHMQSY